MLLSSPSFFFAQIEGNTSVYAKNSSTQVHEAVNIAPLQHASYEKVYPSSLERAGLPQGPSPLHHFVLILDFWERMVNVQSALKRIVQIGVDADFVVVEPFVYESQVSRRLSVPEHFVGRGLHPQVAGQYFDTGELYATNKFVSYKTFTDVVANESSNSSYIDSVLIFDWDNPTRGGQSYWCHERLSEFGLLPLKGKSTLWQLSDAVKVGGALCVSPMTTMTPKSVSASFFDALFHKVHQRSVRTQISGNFKCSSCVSVAFLNYRKHAFTGYVSATGLRPFERRNPPMRVGQTAMRLAWQLHNVEFGGKPFVAIQMRTGKAWVLSGQEANVFIPWLSSCVEKALVAVRVARNACKADGISGYPGIYIASDIYNSGWKGGEVCTPDVCDALENVKSLIEVELRPVRFKPSAFNITQDIMGMSSAVDVAMSLLAERFVYASPSNLGRWVHDQRDAHFRLGTATVNCNVFGKER